jgi:hypothetical protein
MNLCIRVYFCFGVLEIEPRTSSVQGKHSTAELPPTHSLFFKFNFDTGSCKVAQAGLELVILLPQSPKWR